MRDVDTCVSTPGRKKVDINFIRLCFSFPNGVDRSLLGFPPNRRYLLSFPPSLPFQASNPSFYPLPQPSSFNLPSMAPKRAVAKRPSKDFPLERRTKAREEAGASSSIPRPSLNPKFANKILAKSKCLKLNFLDQEGFTFGAKLKTLGLDHFCSLELPVYPNLIKEFLSVAVHIKSGFQGTVRGVEITLTSHSVSAFLNIPREGSVAYESESRVDALNAIMNTDDSNPASIITANDLDIEPRLLLNIVHRIFFPKSGAFEYISERDLAVMHNIVDEHPFDFPKMFMHYLTEAISQPRMNIPYGMAFTKIFLECGLRIPSNEPKELLKSSDYYSISTLLRMGFRKLDGKWVRKPSSDTPHTSRSPPSGPSTSAPQPQYTPSHPSFHPTPDFPTPPSSRADTSSLLEIKDLIASLSDSFSTQLQVISGQNHDLKDELTALRAENVSLRDTLTTRVGDLTNEVLSLRYTQSQLQDQLNRHITNVQVQFQNLHNKMDTLHSSSSSDLSTSSRAIELSDEQIGRIVNALGDSLGDTLRKITAHVNAVYKHVDESGLFTRKMQKKIHERATKLETAIHYIQTFVDEERHYDISGIARETGDLKGKIHSAVQEFEDLLAMFSDRQTTQIQTVFNILTRICDILCRRAEQLPPP